MNARGEQSHHSPVPKLLSNRERYMHPRDYLYTELYAYTKYNKLILGYMVCLLCKYASMHYRETMVELTKHVQIKT